MITRMRKNQLRITAIMLGLIITVHTGTATAAKLRQPQNLVATTISSTQIRITWDDRSSGEDGHQIWRSLDGVWQQIGTVGTGVELYDDTGLTSATEYCYAVRAYSGSSTSSWSNTDCATTNSVASSSSSSSSTSASGGSSWSGPLDLADTALEVAPLVEPNIVLLTDDSGSMDMGIMTTGPDEGGDGDMGIGSHRYFYTHPDPGATAEQPAYNRYAASDMGGFGNVALTEAYLASQGVAAPYLGTWRAWNKDYNQVYYNENVTYELWDGINSTGGEYADANPAAALYDPFRPGHGSLDLATTLPDYTSSYNGSQVTVPGFYPARYYTWTDTDDDGLVDAGDTHALYEIRTAGTCSADATCPTEFVRPATRIDCETDNGDGTVTCTATKELQNFANWFSYYRKRDLAAKAGLGSVVASNTTARIGFATIWNNDSVNIPVASMNISPNSGNKKALLDKIYDMLPFNGTPLRQNLDKVGKYFECKAGDIYGSSVDSTPGSATCPIFTESQGGACQQNFVVLMTDGFYNGSSPSVGNTDKDTGVTASLFDGRAFEDNYSDTLGDVAMNYYERDLFDDAVLPDYVPATDYDQNRYPESGGVYPLDANGDPQPMHQHMTTYTVSYGVSGSLTAMPADPTLSFAWPDPALSNAAKIDDLRHAAYNGRGEYLSADDPEALSSALNQIFGEIGQSEGAASAVAFNTQNIDSGSLVFRAFFNIKKNSGDLVAHKVNLDGTIETTVEEWSAADELKSRANDTGDDRIVFTYKDTGDSTSAGIPFAWASLTTGVGSQQEQLNQPVPANVVDVGDERLGWLRGHTGNEGENFDDGEFRERVGSDGVKELLGDIVHSAPVFVGQPPFSGRDNLPYPNTDGHLYSQYKLAKLGRKELVYAGANDGMLHAFNANTGREEFAYIPNLVFQNLSSLTHPDYVHQFYVDSTPSANDVYINSSWNTVLVGGLGKGGKGYYALNVTDPSSFDTETNAAANVMWEFNNMDDNALGYSYSQPLIAMSNAGADGAKKWVAIFGNGYNSSSTDGDAYLFVVDLAGGLDGEWTEGTDYVKIATGNGRLESGTDTPNGIGGIRGIDLDHNGTVDYVYAGDLQGNLYRFDLNDSTAINNFHLDGLLYKARYDDVGHTQPITNEPVAIKHPDSGGLIVIFGTGSWMTTDDRTNTAIQSIYGVWDDLGALADATDIDSTANGTVTHGMLVQQHFINQLNEEEGYVVRTSTSNEVVWDNSGADQVRGWYINFDMASADGTKSPEFPGERAVRRFHIRGGLLFVNSIIPKTDNICEVGAGGFELGFCPETGGACDKIIFDLNGDGIFDISDNVGNFEGNASIVTGKRFEGSTPADSSFIGDTQVTQTSDKSIRTSKTNTGGNSLQGRHSWREIGFE